jgi:multicomponent Na+:H+ antiporter subunit D
MTITPNPGFAILLGAALALILPRGLRAPAMIAGAVGALFLMFEPSFGAGATFAQIGLEISPLRLDPLSQIFGLGFALLTAIFALYAASREDKLEDIALMAHAGGAVTAVFAGDMVSFVAAAQFSAFAGAALIFAGRTPRARAAGVRYVCWQFLAGALMTAGVGFAWASTGAIEFERMAPQSLQGALFFTGLLIMVGAPLAHVWMKDGLPETRVLGGAALSVFALKLGAYALARAFPGETWLMPIGAALALGVLPLAALSGNVRQAAAYGVLSQSGAAIAAIGAGTPLALAGAAALSFAGMLHGALALLALGLACERSGTSEESELGGLARSMPITALLAIVAALSTMAAPGFVGFTAAALHGEAIAQEERPLLWLALVAASAGGALHIGGRLPYAVFFGTDRGQRPADADFSAQLAMGLAAFFCIAIGVAPGWLYALLPDKIFLNPYDWDQIISRTELMLFAAAAFGAARLVGLYPAQRAAETIDIDWLWRGPGRRVLGFAGAHLVALYEAGRAGFAGLYALGANAAAKLADQGDRPAAADAAGIVWAMVVLTVTMVLLFAFQG